MEMTLTLDHIAVAVKNIEQATKIYQRALNLPFEGVEEVPTESSRVAFFDLGGAHLELVEPTDPSSPMGKSLEKRGEGLHHICLRVSQLEPLLKMLKQLGLPIVNEEPRPGANGSRIVFLHPKGFHGVLIELVERPSID